ncbi:MAG: GNAT family N-acetyltransferase [Ruminococcus sp.]|nr:GNAT family N-acetyltransferase [Ruminococcus sp.]
MKSEIIKLDITDYQKCSNIWDMKRHSELAEKFYNELLTGNRTTYIYTINNEFVGEISLVKEMNDSDYTIPNLRIYVSRLIVKYEYRRQGIDKKLVDFITEKAKSQGYTEMSIGVDLDNYPALKLYMESGFDKVIYIGEDEQGKYLKLLKM